MKSGEKIEGEKDNITAWSEKNIKKQVYSTFCVTN